MFQASALQVSYMPDFVVGMAGVGSEETVLFQVVAVQPEDASRACKAAVPSPVCCLLPESALGIRNASGVAAERGTEAARSKLQGELAIAKASGRLVSVRPRELRLYDSLPFALKDFLYRLMYPPVLPVQLSSSRPGRELESR
ncbi:hypothetical protein AYX22_10045 [Arthrobacter sp. D5-1]|nr:hypothetical protein AYX22_10045 [Arthrobacter sp. D5-1]